MITTYIKTAFEVKDMEEMISFKAILPKYKYLGFFLKRCLATYHATNVTHKKTERDVFFRETTVS